MVSWAVIEDWGLDEVWDVDQTLQAEGKGIQQEHILQKKTS